MENENRARTVKVSELPPTLEVSAGLIANRCYKDQDFMEGMKSDVKSVFKHNAETFYKDHVEDGHAKQEALSLLDQSKDALDALDIVVCRNTSKKWHIPLPPAGGHKDKALSEEELQQVSGGEVIGGLFITGVASAATGGLSIATFLGGLVGIGTTAAASGAIFSSSVTAAVGGALFVAGVTGAAIAATSAVAGVGIGLAVGLSK